MHTYTPYYLYLKYPGISRQNSATHLSDGNALDIQERSTMEAAKMPTPEPAIRQEMAGAHVLWDAVAGRHSC